LGILIDYFVNQLVECSSKDPIDGTSKRLSPNWQEKRGEGGSFSERLNGSAASIFFGSEIGLSASRLHWLYLQLDSSGIWTSVHKDMKQLKTKRER
jgi:hypothetical protein